MLERFVTEQGEVDVAAVAQDRADLDRYVHPVADQPLDDIADGAPHLAHRINVYNALSMFNAIKSDILATHAGTAKITFFAWRKLRTSSREMLLCIFENKVIRPDGRARQDPRFHFALNCSSVSCPVLLRKPSTPPC